MKPFKTTTLLLILFCIETSAQTATINGYWQLNKVEVGDKTYDNLKAIYAFQTDGVLLAGRSIEEKAIEIGTWKTNNDMLIMNSNTNDKDFNGKATIITLNKTDLVYKKSEAILYFKRTQKPEEKPVPNARVSAIEILDFSMDDFFDENDEYKYYNDEALLPWNNSHDLLQHMSSLNEIIYHYIKIDNDGLVNDNKTLTSHVKADTENESLSVDFIFYGYDANCLPDDTALPPNQKYQAPLYPEKENTFRIAGSEKIMTQAGEFECTVIELVGEFDELRKLWMINDKPGIYAKIIVHKPGDWGYNAVYELEAIR